MEGIAEKVRGMVKYCMYTNEELWTLPKKNGDKYPEPPEGGVIVHGIVNSYCFHPGRVAEKKEEIREILKQMHPNFHKSSNGGGGWSFLNLCVDKEGTQWGEHRDVEALILLGIAVGLAKYCLPREQWKIFDGGMPYVTFMCD